MPSSIRRPVHMAAAVAVTAGFLAATSAATAPLALAATPRESTPGYCQAGSGYQAEGRVDCTAANPSTLPGIADAVLPIIGVELPVDLADFNSASSISILGLSVGRQATIAGDGYTTAVAAAKGTASAVATSKVGGAVAAGVLGTAEATSGPLGFAVAARVPEIDGVGSAALLIFASPRGTAISNARYGAAIALNTGRNMVRTGVFGGLGTAIADSDHRNDRVTCAALYCKASVEGGPSTESWLVLLGKDTPADADAPTAYSLRNPFSATLSPIVTPGLQSTVDFATTSSSLFGGAIGSVLPGPLGEALQKIDLVEIAKLSRTPIALRFDQDVVRLVTGGTDNVFRIESDLPILRELLQIVWPGPATAVESPDNVAAARSIAAPDMTVTEAQSVSTINSATTSRTKRSVVDTSPVTTADSTPPATTSTTATPTPGLAAQSTATASSVTQPAQSADTATDASTAPTKSNQDPVAPSEPSSSLGSTESPTALRATPETGGVATSTPDKGETPTSKSVDPGSSVASTDE